MLTIVGIVLVPGGMTVGAVHLMAQRDDVVAQRNRTCPVSRR